MFFSNESRQTAKKQKKESSLLKIFTFMSNKTKHKYILKKTKCFYPGNKTEQGIRLDILCRFVSLVNGRCLLRMYLYFILFDWQISLILIMKAYLEDILSR